jgi:hypothetical protein
VFQPSNRLATFNENCSEFFNFGKYPNLVRTILFWVITQWVVVTSYGRFGATYRSCLHVSGIQKDFYSCFLKMRPLVNPETSIRNYHYSLRNNPAERSSYLLRGGSLKSTTQIPYFIISLINYNLNILVTPWDDIATARWQWRSFDSLHNKKRMIRQVAHLNLYITQRDKVTCLARLRNI